MVTGRNPWRYATVEDEGFAAYLGDRDSLRRLLPISKGANEIIKRIFRINPLSRISIPELREEILKIDTFFMTDRELAQAPLSLRATAHHYSARVPSEDMHPSVFSEDTLFEGESTSSEGSSLSVSSNEILGLCATRPDSPLERPDLVVPFEFIVTSPSNQAGGPSSRSSSNSSGSGSESEGPITPASHAVDPAIEVPDLPEGQNMDNSVVKLTTGFAPSSLHAGDPKDKPTMFSKRRIFQSAVNRIRALGN